MMELVVDFLKNAKSIHCHLSLFFKPSKLIYEVTLGNGKEKSLLVLSTMPH